MMKNIVVIILGLFWCLFVQAGNPAGEFEKANALYKADLFDSAVVAYQELVEEGYASHNLFYNLGNSYYRLEEIGKAILYYEKALKIDPNNVDAEQNLAIAKLNITDTEGAISVPRLQAIWQLLVRSCQPAVWGMFSIVGAVLILMLCCVLFLSSRARLKKLSFVGLFPASLILVFGLVFGYAGTQMLQKSKAGIVLSKSTYIKSEPSEAGTELFILHEGTKLLILKENEAWTRIQYDDNKVGWIENSDFESI